MAARSIASSTLSFGLVNVPVKLYSATESSSSVRFNMLDKDGSRLKQQYISESSGKVVERAQMVKGYEFEKGRYVIVDEDDIDKVRVDSTRVINLEKFTDDTAIDPIYLERPYYLAPDGPVARQAFAVIREGMAGKAGIGKVALLDPLASDFALIAAPQTIGFALLAIVLLVASVGVSAVGSSLSLRKFLRV